MRGLGAAVALAAIVAFLPIVGNGFVDWDDEANIVANDALQHSGWASVRWAWTTFLLGVYQPLAWLLLAAQHALWKLDPRGYHAASLLLHALNAVLLYAATIALLRRGDARRVDERPHATAVAAAFTATLFAVHPLRTEVVAWVSAQPYLPCAAFCLLSLLAYLRAIPDAHAHREPDRRWLIASWALFCGALLSKAMALLFPLVLLAIDIYPLRRLGHRAGIASAARWRAVLVEKLPFVGLSVVFAAIAVAAKSDASLTHGVAAPKVALSAAQLVQSTQAIVFYLQKTFVPKGVNAYYAASRTVDLTRPEVLLSVAVVIAVSVLLWRLRRRWPALAVACIAYLVLLAPTLGLLRYSGQFAADRYSYLPIMGLHVVLAWTLLRALGALDRRPAAVRRSIVAVSLACAAVLGAALGAHSWTLSRTWKDSHTLWTWADAHGGRTTAEVQNYLGVAKLKAGDGEEAMRRFVDAARLRPEYADPYSNQAVFWGVAGDYLRAEAGFRKALSLNPAMPETHRNLGLALERQGRIDEAIGEYAAALRQAPRNGRLLAIVQLALREPGVDREIAAAAERVLLRPTDTAAHAALRDAVGRAVSKRSLSGAAVLAPAPDKSIPSR